MARTLIILTGPQGSGKTSMCLRLTTLMRTVGLDAAGILCPARMAVEAAAPTPASVPPTAAIGPLAGGRASQNGQQAPGRLPKLPPAWRKILISAYASPQPTKVGIEAMDLRTGEYRLLARRRDPAEMISGAYTDAWVFDEEVVEWGNAVLRAATPCHSLIVDELGPLEFEQGRGLVAGLEAISSRAYRQACVVVRPRLVFGAMDLWPEAMVVDVGDPLQRANLQVLFD